MSLRSTLNNRLGIKSMFWLSVIILIFSFSQNMYSTYKFEKIMNSVLDSLYVVNQYGEPQTMKRTANKSLLKSNYRKMILEAYNLIYAINEGNFDNNMSEVLHLFGETGKQIKFDYDNYKGKGMKFYLKSRNMKCEVEATINDVEIDFSTYPYKGTIRGIQVIKRLRGTGKRILECSFEIYKFPPYDKNLYGGKIENWEIIKSENLGKE